MKMEMKRAQQMTDSESVPRMEQRMESHSGMKMKMKRAQQMTDSESVPRMA